MSSRTEKPKVILLFGATGVGKTALLGRMFSQGVELVSADALQIYRQLDIGTAKPDTEILSRIPHHLINILDYSESFSVGDFCTRADEAVQEILQRGNIPILSGGTAYYLKSWLLGMPATPVSNPQLRGALELKWADKSDDELKKELELIDPVSADRISRGDRYRMLRALEVHLQSGRSLSSYKVPDTPREDYQVLSIGLKRERSELYHRINQRVEKMFEEGLAEEVAALRNQGAIREHPGMKAIGYREWFGEPGEPVPDAAAVKELIARNTRRYAKRQITFFSSLPEVHWFDASEDSGVPGGIISLIDDYLKNNTIRIT
ncbi:MAG: tRNA (adenosine(37)-N6)-dimethylallyltransferase MiaA [Spirochaetes bacterium]|nr:MAG: tRNA (adenosine(37)-N6)-dimethylallyltransferase MiaA [Spirochaetota bacterium]